MNLLIQTRHDKKKRNKDLITSQTSSTNQKMNMKETSLEYA